MKWFKRTVPVLAAVVFLAGCGRGQTVITMQNTSADVYACSNESESVSVTDDPAERPDTVSDEKTELPAITAEPLPICVYVCGAVKKPGVYRLPEGSRVYEAIEAAGGLNEDAESRSLNQAERLNDGEQITVYTKEEIVTAGEKLPGSGSTGNNSPGGLPGLSGNCGSADGIGQENAGRVNINTASSEQLMTLPGIGAARAAAIIAYRETNGAFSSIEAIQNVEGIKEKAFNKIKDLIEV